MSRCALYSPAGIFSVYLAFAVWGAFPQQGIRLELQIVDDRQVKVLHSAPLLVQVPIRCDSAGNLYFQGYDSQNLSAAPVNRISADGSQVSQISLRRAPGFEAGEVYDFAVSPRGEVYFLAARKAEQYEIVRFSDEGQYQSSFQLDKGIYPINLAVFNSGEILISGAQRPRFQGDREGAPLLALYDRTGQLLSEFSIARDTLPEIKLKESIVPGMTFGVPGDDGNLYLLRRTEPPAVFVLSSSGLTLRRVVLRPPGDSYRASSFRVYGGRLLVEFEALSAEQVGLEQIFALWDASTGQPIAEYVAQDPVSGILACYSSEGLTLLQNRPNSGLHLLRARL